MGNLNLSSAIKTYGEKKRESLTAEKAQGDNKIDSLEDKDKDRTFMIKESNELSPTNKLRFAEVSSRLPAPAHSLPGSRKRGISFSGRAGAKQRHYEKMQVVRKLQGESPARLQQTWGSGSLGVPRLRTTSSLIPAGKNSRVLEFEGLRGEPPPVRQEYEFEELE
eukprot:756247-Hanusia_phi.AAC.8